MLQAARVPRAQVRPRVQAALENVGLAAVAGHLVEDLSGGQQQRVAVAHALVTAAEVVRRRPGPLTANAQSVTLTHAGGPA